MFSRGLEVFASVLGLLPLLVMKQYPVFGVPTRFFPSACACATWAPSRKVGLSLRSAYELTMKGPVFLPAL